MKIYKLIFALFLLPIAGCVSEKTINSQNDYGEMDKTVSIDGFNRDGDSFLNKVCYDTETFSFINKVSVPDNYSWYLYYDFESTSEIKSKTIKCSFGDNFVYLLVANEKETIGFYSVNVYRYHLYTVTFDTAGGTNVPEQHVQEESFISPVDVPIKTGYSFDSWSYDFLNPVMSDLCVVASWNANHYNILLDPDGGIVSTTAIVATYGASISLPIPTKTGYKFLGWYYENTLVNSSSWNIPLDATIIAKWAPVVYLITYHLNGGTMGSGSNPSTYTIETSINSFSAPTRNGYSFSGWYKNEELTEEITSIPLGTIGDIDLYAKWEALTFELTIISDNIKGTVYGAGKYKCDSNVNVFATAKTGYSFSGWYISETKVHENASYSFNMPPHNIELEARWTPIIYNVTYVLDGGTNNDFNPSSYTIEDNTLQFLSPEKSGYSFLAWHLNSLQGEVVNSFETNNCTDITLYAAWAINSYNVFINSIEGAGTIIGAGQHVYNSEVTVSASSNGQPYTFIGWYKEGNLVSSSNTYIFTMPHEDVYLEAKFDILVGANVTFGLYPQARYQGNLTSTLNNLAGELPTETNHYSWNDFGYYYQGSVKSYAFYQDITYNGTKYRGIHYLLPRQWSSKATDTSSSSYHTENGYVVGTTYWFVFSSIDWIVINNTDGMVSMISSFILDSQDYDHDGSFTYQTSDIKQWLDNQFYNTAFLSSEKEKIDNGGSIDLITSSDFAKHKTSAANLSYSVLATQYAISQNLNIETSQTKYCSVWWVNGSSDTASFAVFATYIVKRDSYLTWPGVRPVVTLKYY